MVIRLPGRALFVVRSLPAPEDMETLVCRDDERPDGRLYTLLVYHRPAEAYDAISIFVKLRQRGTTPDFIDCFSMGSRFYALFLYREPSPLKKQVDGMELHLRERLEAAHGIFQQILMQDLPHAILMECLRPENLNFDTTLAVTFNYFLGGAARYRMIGLKDAMGSAADVLEHTLGKDAKRQDTRERSLNDICLSLREGGYESWKGAYADFLGWYEVIRDNVEIEKQKKEGMIAKFWRIVSRVMGLLKPLIAVALIAASVGYLVYSIMNPPIPAGAAPGQIQAVGDIPIPSPTPTDTPAE